MPKIEAFTFDADAVLEFAREHRISSIIFIGLTLVLLEWVKAKFSPARDLRAASANEKDVQEGRGKLRNDDHRSTARNSKRCRRCANRLAPSPTPPPAPTTSEVVRPGRGPWEAGGSRASAFRLARVFGRQHAGLRGHHQRTKTGRSEPSGRRDARAARREWVFPDWPRHQEAEQPGLLWWFTRLFARPFPEFSAAQREGDSAAGGWLMGPFWPARRRRRRDGRTRGNATFQVGDGMNQLVFVKRCRFLEQSGCASVCVNACKFPTQDLFNGDMGVPMRIEPDYGTLSCSFKFGLAPSIDDEVDALYAVLLRVPVGRRAARRSTAVPGRPDAARRCSSSSSPTSNAGLLVDKMASA